MRLQSMASMACCVTLAEVLLATVTVAQLWEAVSCHVSLEQPITSLSSLLHMAASSRRRADYTRPVTPTAEASERSELPQT